MWLLPALVKLSKRHILMSFLESKRCSAKLLKYMISKYPADVDYQDSSLNTPMHIVLQHSGDKLNLVRELLAAGANLNACNVQGRSALHYAVLYSDDVAILRELMWRGAKLHLKDDDDNSPLHLAVINNKKSFVQALVLSGADVDMKNSELETPLIIAVKNDNLEIVKLLLRSKASLLVSCRNLLTPLHVAVDRPVPNQGILIELVRYGADMFRSDARRSSPLNFLMEKFDTNPISSLFCIKTLLKCGVLQDRFVENTKVNPIMAITLYKLNQVFESENFIEECTLEIQKMKMECIHKNFSLFDFVRDGFESDPLFWTKAAYRECVINCVLCISRKYPLYTDIIAYRFEKIDLCKKAMELCVYAFKEGKQQIFLPPDVIFLISRLLSNEELLNFIVAFSDPQNFATCECEFLNVALRKSVKRKLF